MAKKVTKKVTKKRVKKNVQHGQAPKNLLHMQHRWQLKQQLKQQWYTD